VTQATSLVTATLAGQIASRQILRYAGYAYDAESGLYYCSARYYDPATRQWTTGDPAKADGEESAYQYCGGEPNGQVDPTGNAFVKFRTPPVNKSKSFAYLKRVLRENACYSMRAAYKAGSKAAAAIWFYRWEKKGARWDFKTGSYSRRRWWMGSTYRYVNPEEFGNFHYGYMGRMVGFTKDQLLAVSWMDYAEQFDESDVQAWKNEYHDEQMIASGYSKYGSWGMNTATPYNYYALYSA
jgi:RHS repeat-associated protein